MKITRKIAAFSLSAFLAFLASPPLFAAPPAQRIALAEALNVARLNNPDLRLSGLALESAAAGILAANVAPNPALTLGVGGYNPQLGIGPGPLRSKTFDTMVRVDQVIERGGKRALRTQNANELQQAARADLGDVARQVQLNVSSAYFDLMAAQERVRILRETAALFDRTLDAANKRKQAGDIAGADVARLEVDALRSRNDARQAEADLVVAQRNLAQAMGLAPDAAVLETTDAWPDPAAVSLDAESAQRIEQWIEQRADVRAAMARVDAAVSAYKLALSLRKRDVSVGVQYDHFPVSEANPIGTGNTYAVSVQIPLFINNYYTGEIRAADLAQDSARQNLEKVKNAARHDISRAREQALAATERVQRFESELLKASDKANNAAEFAFKSGASNVMDVLDARRTYRATQLEAIAARADYAKSLLNWRLATAPYAEQETK